MKGSAEADETVVGAGVDVDVAMILVENTDADTERSGVDVDVAMLLVENTDAYTELIVAEATDCGVDEDAVKSAGLVASTACVCRSCGSSHLSLQSTFTEPTYCLPRTSRFLLERYRRRFFTVGPVGTSPRSTDLARNLSRSLHIILTRHVGAPLPAINLIATHKMSVHVAHVQFS